MQEPNPTRLADLVALMPFAVGLGIELDAATTEEVVGRMPWRAELCTAGGVLHGGGQAASDQAPSPVICASPSRRRCSRWA